MEHPRPLPNQPGREARRFLQALYGSKPDDLRLVLWTWPERQSINFLTADDAATWIGEGRKDTYIHTALSAVDVEPSRRIDAQSAAGLAGVWADLDISHPVHKKAGLPETEHRALEVIASLGLQPTITVHSGHGLQCWWLFGEVWVLDSEAERVAAATLARAWNINIRTRGKRLGFDFDSVGDLARLLRVPGTINAKASPVPVEILALDDTRRVTRDDIEAALVDGAWEQAERESNGGRVSRAYRGGEGDLLLHSGAEPPWEKLDALREAEPLFGATWDRRRKDLASPSEYDLSIANYATRAGWPRQEIANAMIAWRRRHGEDLKLRQDYYAATIDKAADDRDADDAIADALAAVKDAQGQTAEPGEHDKRALLAQLSAAVGVQLDALWRSRGQPSVFSIDTPHGSGSIGGISSLIENGRFRARVGEITGILPRRMKNDRWDRIAQGLLMAAELLEPVGETTVVGQVETWISLYLGTQRRQALEDMDDRDRRLLPNSLESYTELIDGERRTVIFATGFRRWLIAEQHESKISTSDLAEMLRAYGATPRQAYFRTEAKPTTRTIWLLPVAAKTEEADRDKGLLQ